MGLSETTACQSRNSRGFSGNSEMFVQEAKVGGCGQRAVGGRGVQHKIVKSDSPHLYPQADGGWRN